MYYFVDENEARYSLRPVGEEDLPLLAFHRNSPRTWENLTVSLPVWPHKQTHWLDGLGMGDMYFISSVQSVNKKWDVGILRITDIDWQNRNAAIGVDTFEGYRGKGYGTRFFDMGVSLCFEEFNLHRLWLMVLDTNDIAYKIYANAGFTTEGRLKDHIFRHDEYHDYILMGLTCDEWRGKRAAI